MKTTQDTPQTYPGGKAGSGVYQTIINHIPEHKIYLAPFAGHDAVIRHMKRPKRAFLNDSDLKVFEWWLNYIHQHPKCSRHPAGKLFATSQDWRDFLQEYRNQYRDQAADIFIFADPPYLMKSRSSPRKIYNRDFNKKSSPKNGFGDEEEHVNLLNYLNQLQEEKVMISHYPCDLYEEKLENWHRITFQGVTQRGRREEALYMNYSLDRLHDYQYIGHNYRDRETQTKLVKRQIEKLQNLPEPRRSAMLQAIQEVFFPTQN